MPRTAEELAALAKEMGITEIIGMDVGKGVAVGAPANGTPWLLLKSLAEVEWEQFAKAKYNADDLKDLASKGKTIKNANGDESYPINDQEDLEKAIKAVGRGSANHDDIRAHIMTQAKKLGLTKLIPDNWNTDGTLAKALYVRIEPGAIATPNKVADALRDHLSFLAKAASDDMASCKTCDGSGKINEGTTKCPNCDATGKVAKDSKFAKGLPAGTLVVGADGSIQVPGSAQWEAQDADLLTQAAQMLAQIITMISEARDREMTEANAGCEEDWSSAYSLWDACDALNSALSVVAALAFTEAQESDDATDMTKGLMAKEGKTLSAATRQTIQEAHDRLTALLGKGDDDGSTDNDAESGDMIKEIENMNQEQLQQMLDASVAKAFESKGFAKSLRKEAKKILAGENAGVTAPVTPLAKAEGEAPPAADPPAGDPAPAPGTEAPPAADPPAGDAVPTGNEATLAKALEAITSNQAELTKAVALIAGTPQQGGPFGGDIAALGITDAGDIKTQLAKALANAKTPEQRERIGSEVSQANLTALYSGGTPVSLK